MPLPTNLSRSIETLMTGAARNITTLLAQGAGDANAETELFRLIQQRFRNIAGRLLARERPGHGLQPTMLVDDAFLQLIRARNRDWHSREEFFAHAARIMRHLLVDQARIALASKRGGGDRPLELDQARDAADDRDPQQLIELNEILERLERDFPDVFQVFDLHFFMKFELQEIAEDILDVSYSTVRRRWSMARAFLHRELVGEDA